MKMLTTTVWWDDGWLLRLFVLSHFSCVRLFATYGPQPCRLLCPWDAPGKNTGVGIFLLTLIWKVCYWCQNKTFRSCRLCILPFLHFTACAWGSLCDDARSLHLDANCGSCPSQFSSPLSPALWSAGNHTASERQNPCERELIAVSINRIIGRVTREL